MLSYISWYQEAASFLRARHPQRRVINATAAGALLSGFEHLDLAGVLAGLPDLSIDFNDLASALDRLPKPSAERLGQRLAQSRSEVRRARGLLDQHGLPQTRSQAPAGSATAAALEQAMNIGGPEAAKAQLDLFAAALVRMSESLYV